VGEQAILPTAFSQSCARSTACEGNVLVLSNYYSPEADSVNVILKAIQQYPNLLTEDRTLKTTVLSGGLLLLV
jgi:hypothetical protein